MLYNVFRLQVNVWKIFTFYKDFNVFLIRYAMPRLFDREDLIPEGLIKLDHCSLSKSEAFKYNAIFVKSYTTYKKKI